MDPGSAAVTLIAGAAGGARCPPDAGGGHPLPSQCPSTASGGRGRTAVTKGRTAWPRAERPRRARCDAPPAEGPKRPGSGRTLRRGRPRGSKEGGSDLRPGPTARPLGQEGGRAASGEQDPDWSRLVMAREAVQGGLPVVGWAAPAPPTLSRGRPAAAAAGGSQSPDTLDAGLALPDAACADALGKPAPRRAPGSVGPPAPLHGPPPPPAGTQSPAAVQRLSCGVTTDVGPSGRTKTPGGPRPERTQALRTRAPLSSVSAATGTSRQPGDVGLLRRAHSPRFPPLRGV